MCELRRIVGEIKSIWEMWQRAKNQLNKLQINEYEKRVYWMDIEFHAEGDIKMQLFYVFRSTTLKTTSKCFIYYKHISENSCYKFSISLKSIRLVSYG